MSPAWCVLQLWFAPIIVYATLAMDELFGLAEIGTIAAAAACVVAASLGHKRGPDEPTGPVNHRTLYGAVLLGILVLCGIPGATAKSLGLRAGQIGPSIMEQFGDVYFTMVYVGLGVTVWADVLLRKRPPVPVGPWVGLALLAGIGSTGGCMLMALGADMPAVIFFPTDSITSILTASVVSILAFGEKFNRAWVATVGFGVLAVAFAALGN